MHAFLNKGNQLTESSRQRCIGKFNFSYKTSLLQIGCVYLEKLSYGLQHTTKDLYSKRGPILMNTDRLECKIKDTVTITAYKYV